MTKLTERLRSRCESRGIEVERAIEDPLTFLWRDSRGTIQGMITPGPHGILVTPDDDHYAGRVSAEDALELAQAILHVLDYTPDDDDSPLSAARRDVAGARREAGMLVEALYDAHADHGALVIQIRKALADAGSVGSYKEAYVELHARIVKILDEDGEHQSGERARRSVDLPVF